MPEASIGDLEKRINELETQIQRFRLGGRLGSFSAGDCTNGCTDACTRGCTNGCTGGGCLQLPQTTPQGGP
jgi:hypothetical protein